MKQEQLPDTCNDEAFVEVGQEPPLDTPEMEVFIEALAGFVKWMEELRNEQAVSDIETQPTPPPDPQDVA